MPVPFSRCLPEYKGSDGEESDEAELSSLAPTSDEEDSDGEWCMDLGDLPRERCQGGWEVGHCRHPPRLCGATSLVP